MGLVKMELWDAAGRVKQGFDSYFLYTAYAPIDAHEVLVKIGISTIPYQRFVAIHCNSPYPIEYAAFTSIGTKKNTLACERRILETFQNYKTRGEWLRIPTTKEFKEEFALKTRAIVGLVTGKPVNWQRVNGKQIKAYMSARMKDLNIY